MPCTSNLWYPLSPRPQALGASLARANRERGASWEGCSPPIPQHHAHHHITRRDAWGRGSGTQDRSFAQAISNKTLND